MRVALAYKNFGAVRGVSHIGLGVTAINTMKCLKRKGIATEVWPVLSAKNIEDRLWDAGERRPTHVVISAFWLSVEDLRWLADSFSDVEFIVLSHSNVGFLAADTKGITLMRACLDLQMASANFRVAANNERLSTWVNENYAVDMLTLPNLYFLERDTVTRRVWSGGTLRVGVFGAMRPLKNQTNAVAAAMQIGRELNTKVEIHLNSGRNEGGSSVRNSIFELTRNVPHVEVKEAGWLTWPEFVRLAGYMHLLLSPSYTESFNNVTADAASQGVPSVVSDAIDWAPKYWQAETDDAFDIAHVGRALLSDPRSAQSGLDALKKHNRYAIDQWTAVLEGDTAWLRAQN